MKKIVTLILLSVICLLVVSELYASDLTLKGTQVTQRDSMAFVYKSVNEMAKPALYGTTKDAEDGSANLVTSIVVNYRSFDTLGEVTVLFIASLGIAFLLGGASGKLPFFDEPNFMLRVGGRMIAGFVLILGLSMMAHGHLTPGGGFPGGSLIAAAFLLLYLSDPALRGNLKAFKMLEGTMGTLYVLLGIVGLLSAGAFLQNFLPTGVIGSLFSGGLIPIIYVVIGLKVGSELIGLISNFADEEVAK